MRAYCGIDFGTTNTVVTVMDEHSQIVDSFSVPTILFIDHQNHGISRVHIGSDALKQFEDGAQGRYMHSIKRSLHDSSLKQTIINREKVTLEQLIRFFLEELNHIMHARLGYVPHNIVLGRPVVFSQNPEEDELAKQRLLEGFSLSGYKRIELLEEPVAASLSFDAQLDEHVNTFLIVDLGGGTSDFTVASCDPLKNGIDRYTILGVHGVDMGGDHFDEDLMFETLSPALGMHATYNSFNKELPMPVHLYRDISTWNKIHPVNKKAIKDEFSDYQYKSSDREAVLKLRRIMEQNLSRKILYKVRESKHDLALRDETVIDYEEKGVDIRQKVEKREFEKIIDPRLEHVTEHILHILEKTSKSPEDIDKVILTGGTSQIPRVRKKIEKMFSPEIMLYDSDFHNSVSRGLALYAYYHDICLA
jgi:hypothetical chaperone protein